MKKQAIKNALESIAQYQQSIKLLDKLPDGPFDFLVDIKIIGNIIFVTIPFDLSVFKVYRKAMGKGWQCDGWSSTSHDTHASKNRCYWPKGGIRREGSTVLLSLDTGLDGSTCELVKVGVEEKPVFEVVCK